VILQGELFNKRFPKIVEYIIFLERKIVEMAIVTFLLIGWILGWFGFHKLFIQAFKELFKLEISKASYYFIFFCIGFFGDFILFFQGTYELILL
jgi:hypothetical protein